jgi:flagellar protein FlgJ
MSTNGLTHQAAVIRGLGPPLRQTPTIALSSGALSAAKRAKLADAAEQFEASMLREMLKPLQFGAAADAGGEESAGGAADTIRGLGTDALAKALASHGGLGIARKIVKEVTAEHQAVDKREKGTKVL